MIFGAYCVGKVHNMYLGGTMIMGAYCVCRVTQYATSVVL